MSEATRPKISPVPFILADLLFLAAAAYIVYASEHPLEVWQILSLLAAVAGGAWCSFIPFFRQFNADLQLAESGNLATAVTQIQGMEGVARQIQTATSQWQFVQEQAAKTSAAAKEVADRMTVEIKAFSAFMEKTDTGEKQHLRLEIEKLRRAEGEWLQACVRILDHVFALYTAAVRSGQPALIEQLSQFKNACFDAFRRLGLSVFAVNPEEPYNPSQHNLPPNTPETAPGARLEGTLALGITYQGQILRKPMVALRVSSHPDTAGAAPPTLRDATEAIMPQGPASTEEDTDKKKIQGKASRLSSSGDPEKSDASEAASAAPGTPKPPSEGVVEQELF